MANSIKPPIRKGPEGGRYQQYGRGGRKQRRLLPKRKVQTGPKGGKFQEYKPKGQRKKDKRYLLHKKNRK